MRNEHFVNDILCSYYRSIWNKCKKLRKTHMIHQYYTISSTVRVKIEENYSPKSVTHKVDLERLFTDVDFESL